MPGISRNFGRKGKKPALFRIKIAFSLLGNGTKTDWVLKLWRLRGLGPESGSGISDLGQPGLFFDISAGERGGETRLQAKAKP